MTKLKLVKVKVIDSSVPQEYDSGEGVRLPNGQIILVSSSTSYTWVVSPHQVQVLEEVEEQFGAKPHSLKQMLGQDVKTLTVEFK